MTEVDTLLRELNHRVNNNFQIVVSLMNLKKRLLPPDRQSDLRFIEEHVQSMAVAYRLIHTGGDGLEVNAVDLLTDVILGLRLVAKCANERVILDLALNQLRLGLDQAIALGLYLAVILPPYLDRSLTDRVPVTISAKIEADRITVEVAHGKDGEIELDFLRERLMVAYVSQLGADQRPSDGTSTRCISFVAAKTDLAVN